MLSVSALLHSAEKKKREEGKKQRWPCKCKHFFFFPFV